MTGDDKPTGSQGDPQPAPQEPKQPAQGADAGKQGAAPEPKALTPEQYTALLKKIDDLEIDNKKYRDKDKVAEEKRKKEEEEAAKKRGEFEKLFNEKDAQLEPLKKQNERLTETIGKTLKMQLGQHSAEEVQEFTNFFGNLSPEEQFEKYAFWSQSKSATKAAKGAQLPLGMPASQVGNAQKNDEAFRAALNQAKSEMDSAKINWLIKNRQAIIEGKISPNK